MRTGPPNSTEMSLGMLVDSLAAVLEKMIEVNADTAGERETATIFDAITPPAIGIRAYLRRIVQYVQCSDECVILALIYIDRLIERRGFAVTQHNAHRVLLSSILIAAKSFDDEFYSNGFFSQVGGVPVVELNSLEMEFLFLMQFSTFVTPEVYNKYSVGIMQAATVALPNPLEETVTTSPTSVQRGIVRRIRECQMEPQNEPPSPKRMLVKVSTSPSACRTLQYIPTAPGCDQPLPKREMSDVCSGNPYQTKTVFKFSPSILCK